MRVILPDLHAENGRIDAQKVADYIEFPLSGSPMESVYDMDPSIAIHRLSPCWGEARIARGVSKASRFTRGNPDSARPTSRPSYPTMLAARRGRAVA